MARVIPLYRLPVYSITNPPAPGVDFAGGGVLLIEKPVGWSSAEVVQYGAEKAGIKKVGHAGVLDPLASGLIALCTGRATKSIAKIQQKPKTYEAELTLGASTPSHDAETAIEKTLPYGHITRTDTEQVLVQHFSGEVWQLPPMFSAIRNNGQRLYDLARQGKVVEREPRKIKIYNAHIISFELPRISLYIKCSSGTYIRTLANDLGIKLDPVPIYQR